MFKDYRVSDPSGWEVIQLLFFKWLSTPLRLQNVISALKNVYSICIYVYIHRLYKFWNIIAYLKFPNIKHGLILNSFVSVNAFSLFLKPEYHIINAIQTGKELDNGIWYN